MNPSETLAVLKTADKHPPYDPCWDVNEPVARPRLYETAADHAATFTPDQLRDLTLGAATTRVVGTSLAVGMVLTLPDGNYRWLEKSLPSITMSGMRRFVAYDRGAGSPVLFETAGDKIWEVVAQ